MREHIKRFIRAYYYFFDHKLKNTTIIVGVIGMLILCVGIVIGGKYEGKQHFTKSNILELQNHQVMIIGDSQYRINIEEIRNEKR